jgi:hypothetical protein
MSEVNEPKHINWRNHLSTILGAVVAIANAWVNVDWNTFELDSKHLFPLFVSAAIAIGGKFTTINK